MDGLVPSFWAKLPNESKVNDLGNILSNWEPTDVLQYQGAQKPRKKGRGLKSFCLSKSLADLLKINGS